jgi:hypothetical protein
VAILLIGWLCRGTAPHWCARASHKLGPEQATSPTSPTKIDLENALAIPVFFDGAAAHLVGV